MCGREALPSHNQALQVLTALLILISVWFVRERVGDFASLAFYSPFQTVLTRSEIKCGGGCFILHIKIMIFSNKSETFIQLREQVTLKL